MKNKTIFVPIALKLAALFVLSTMVYSAAGLDLVPKIMCTIATMIVGTFLWNYIEKENSKKDDKSYKTKY